MNLSLERLIYLVEVKNNLNRRRRRLLMRTYTKHKKIGTETWATVALINGTLTDRAYYQQRYEETKKEMKAMTKEMRSLCRHIGFKLRWNDGGMITSVFEDGWHPYGDGKGKFVVIHYKDFKKYHDSFLVENILLK